MEKAELVVELGVEEIPASMIEDAAKQLGDILTASLAAHRLSSAERIIWYTPRRIIVGIQEIPVRQDDLVETITGPPKSIAYHSDGTPTRAAIAFAQKNRVSLAHIKLIQTSKGEYLSIERRLRGERTHRILQRLIPDAIGKIQFPKTMHWSQDSFRFARPIRWIVALFGGKIVRFSIADVTSSRYSSGHRFLGKTRIPVFSLASLRERLLENWVVVDPEERKRRIIEQLHQQASGCNGKLLDDQELLKTVVNLNEAPSVIRGSFEGRFLNLPQEILITVMREHQKYFSVLDHLGQLMPVFLAVINLPSDSNGIVQAGHERVLKARLADAAFFWETDRKTSLREREQLLRNVLFQEKLGSYYDKTERVRALLPKLAKAFKRDELVDDLEIAGHLFKCDLVTEMVKEFTDLQGIVGGLYARAEGYPEPVWKAIYEHYFPKSTHSSSPSSDTGAILSLADRLDTVCGCFIIGLIPSGSGDPFAVRRQANGILKILLERKWSISLDKILNWSLETYGQVSEEKAKQLKEFLGGRLKFLFVEAGFDHDCIQAAMAAGFDDPLDALERLKAIQNVRQEADFLSVATSFKRIVNILAQAGNSAGKPEESRFQHQAEMNLWQCYCRVRPVVEAARQGLDYARALHSLALMRKEVDEFFNEVMVMVEDAKLRANRIALLNCIAELFRSIADLSKIVIEKADDRSQ